VRQPIDAFAQAHPETRVIPGRFMAIEQAMGTVKGRDAGIAYLRAFIEEMKASGFVARALTASGQGDAVVAPPAT
jgi:polar amino acid transport system substrate-binding protein